VAGSERFTAGIVFNKIASGIPARLRRRDAWG
jgi:hypothetical protein